MIGNRNWRFIRTAPNQSTAVTAFHVHEGDLVESDTPIATISASDGSSVIRSPWKGRILKLIFGPHVVLGPNDPIATIEISE